MELMDHRTYVSAILMVMDIHLQHAVLCNSKYREVVLLFKKHQYNNFERTVPSQVCIARGCVSQ